jgi:sarcosine oxidase subunit alpha
MVMDDGVTACIADDHFHMTTTTGGAARVLGTLEDYLQTEWPELRVWLTSVTEQWAVASICGPNAAALVREICDDLDPDPATFPFMSWREAHIGGVPVRIFRISFTGELSYEINIQASLGLWLWERIFAAGEKYGVTPYGTEAMHLLRAEKGFIIVGQDTDGTVTPHDLRMDRMVKRQDDFIGRRSLFRSDALREDRKQLVGLLPADPNLVLTEGAHIIATPEEPKPPVKMLGHVTSSYFSPTLGRSFALALVEGGGRRMGETLYATWGGCKPAPVDVTKTDFLAALGYAAEERPSQPMPEKTGFVAPPVRHSPLGHRAPISAGNGDAWLCEQKFIGKLIVRGHADDIDPPFASATGFPLPISPCTSSAAGELAALWLGPAEWMLLTPENAEIEMASTIAVPLGQQHYQLADVTDFYTMIRIGGGKSRDMLMKLTTLDMHPAKFPQGAVKGSVFGRVPAVLHCPADTTAAEFDLIIRRSHADYLWCLLALAGREFGLPEQKPAGRVRLARS